MNGRGIDNIALHSLAGFCHSAECPQGKIIWATTTAQRLNIHLFIHVALLPQLVLIRLQEQNTHFWKRGSTSNKCLITALKKRKGSILVIIMLSDIS